MGRPRQIIAPFTQTLGGQRSGLDVAKLGLDEGSGARASIADRAGGAPLAFEKPEIGLHRLGGGEVLLVSFGAWTVRLCPLLRLREAQNGGCRQHRNRRRTIARPRLQVLHRVGFLFAVVAPHHPCAGTVGQLAVAEMQPRLDQPEIRLVRHLQAGAGGAGFEVRVSDGARHGGNPLGSNTGPIYVGKHPWTTMRLNALKHWFLSAY